MGPRCVCIHLPWNSDKRVVVLLGEESEVPISGRRVRFISRYMLFGIYVYIQRMMYCRVSRWNKCRLIFMISRWVLLPSVQSRSAQKRARESNRMSMQLAMNLRLL